VIFLLIQDSQIQIPRHRSVIGAHIQPARIEAKICTRKEIQVLAIGIPHRCDGISHAVRDLDFLTGLDLVCENCLELVVQKAGIGYPF
jgi:hypothetical protein